MLTEERQQQISAEETFREEVRRSLEAQKTRSGRSRAWALLNSSFVLWLLSSVVASGLATAYARYQSRETEAVRKQELVRRLDTEIANRIAGATAGMEVERQNIERKAIIWTVRGLYATVLEYLNNVRESKNQDFSIFPEYKQRSFSSLLVELNSLIDSGEQPDVRRAYAAFMQIARDSGDYSREALPPPPQSEQIRVVDAIGKVLQSEFQRESWRSTVYAR